MTNLLQQGAAWLASQRLAYATTPVTYRRGGAGSQSATWNATVGKTEADVPDRIGLMVHVESRDYLGLASELTAAGITLPPNRGDRIIEADGTTYELMDIKDQGYWRWSDDYRQTLRVHTKRAAADE